MAIVFDDIKFTLIDSIGKKISAVNMMIDDLAMKNVNVINIRSENFSGKFDAIVARAVTNFENFISQTRHLIKPSGKIFYLKGGDCSEDIKLLKKYKLHRVSKLTGIAELSDKVILEKIL